MWTSIYIANSKSQAERIKRKLEDEGILSNIRPVSLTSANSDGMFEIQVLESEAEEAQVILCQNALW